MEASPAFMQNNADNSRCFALLSEIKDSAPPRLKLLVPALLLAVAMLAVYTAGVAPLITTALLASAGMVIIGILTQQEARDAVNWDIYVTIAAAFGIGTAMVNSGVAGGIATGLTLVRERSKRQTSLRRRCPSDLSICASGAGGWRTNDLLLCASGAGGRSGRSAPTTSSFVRAERVGGAESAPTTSSYRARFSGSANQRAFFVLAALAPPSPSSSRAPLHCVLALLPPPAPSPRRAAPWAMPSGSETPVSSP
jgi:hypothetical protein